jgi:phosphoribosylamine--glycine ligase
MACSGAPLRFAAMKVLVLGSGGREHALGVSLARGARRPALVFAPGNAGTAALGRCLPVNPADVASVAALCRAERPDLVVVGPEDPLCAGVADALEREGVKVFGPGRSGARLEGSKVFAKTLMTKYLVPTAAYRSFEDPDRARAYLREIDQPVVVKADGLCAGKGVVVADDRDEALRAVDEIMVQRRFGEAGARVLIEERLTGQEASVMAVTDGRTIAVLEPAQDHKRIFDGDRGPNTGGMGAYSPAPVVTPRAMAQVERDILVPIVHGLGRERIPYRGVIYAGLMVTKGGPRVLEFNCRFGDPETQAVLPRLRTDLLELMLATVEGRLEECSLEWDPRSAVCVVMASAGYPASAEKGVPVEGTDSAAARPDTFVFHAGTAAQDGRLVTAGGRVLGVTALGADVGAAREAAYAAVRDIRFRGAQFRSDIAERAVAP